MRVHLTETMDNQLSPVTISGDSTSLTTPSAEGAEVYIVEPADGDTVS